MLMAKNRHGLNRPDVAEWISGLVIFACFIVIGIDSEFWRFF